MNIHLSNPKAATAAPLFGRTAKCGEKKKTGFRDAGFNFAPPRPLRYDLRYESALVELKLLVEVAPKEGSVYFTLGKVILPNEQALVCLSNREIVDASRGCTFHCKTANNRFFL